MIYLENVPYIFEKNIYSVTTRWNVLYMSLIYLVYSIIQILEKEMATQSITPAWKIPWMEEPGRLQSMQSQRVEHKQLHFLSFYSSFWRRKWQCTPLFLPGESHGQRGLVGYSLWGCKESDTTKQLNNKQQHYPTTCLFIQLYFFIIF